MVESTPTSTMQYLQSPLVQGMDWFGFVALSSTAATLAYRLTTFAPPNSDILYFFGYREHGMISLYVNLFAGVAYYAKVCSHLSGDVNGDFNIVAYKYFDYLITCPLLTFDLLNTLNLPYKITYAIYVLVTLFSGFMAANSPAPGKYLWFAFGMCIFSYTWFNIICLVQVRFIQYFKKKAVGNSNPNKRMSVASKAGFRNKNVRNPLQTALTTYFCIWMAYPILWILLETQAIDRVTEHCINVVMDVLAKSIYGFALLRFQLIMDKVRFEMTELKVTKEDLLEDYKKEKQRMRELRRRAQAMEDGHESLSEDEDEVDQPHKESDQLPKEETSSTSAIPMSQSQLQTLMMQFSQLQQSAPAQTPQAPSFLQGQPFPPVQPFMQGQPGFLQQAQSLPLSSESPETPNNASPAQQRTRPMPAPFAAPAASGPAFLNQDWRSSMVLTPE